MADPRAVVDHHPDRLIRALVRLTIAVTEAPWTLSARDAAQARDDGLAEPAIAHVVAQAALFGHLNRIADAVDVDADYPDPYGAPHLAPATSPYVRPAPGQWPDPAVRRLDVGAIPGAADALAAWRAQALDHDGPLTEPERRLVAATVASCLGDASVTAAMPASPRDAALVELAELVTLAPWRLGPAAYAPLRAIGIADDVAVFDAVATASSCTVFSRIAVALAALCADG